MVVNALVEIPMGTKNKYEIDKETGRIKLDRVLYSSVSYPAEYGYIENTLADDGDALDILILASEQTFPGCIVEARVLGYLDIADNGFGDQKVIAVTDKDPRYDHFQKFDDIPEPTLNEIREFFRTYKHLQGIEVDIKNFHGLEDTIKLIEECQEKYKSAN